MKIALAALAATCLTSPVGAVVFQGSYDIAVNNPGQPGLEILVEKLADPFSFELSKNESFTTDLFRIWTDESSVNAGRNGDDVQPRPISIAFAFTQPTGPGGSLSGETVGVNLLLVHYGELSWSNPVQTFRFGGTELKVALENNVKFNGGLFGLARGYDKGENVSATFTLTAVPEPATWAMMIGGFGLAGAAVRRRTALREATAEA